MPNRTIQGVRKIQNILVGVGILESSVNSGPSYDPNVTGGFADLGFTSDGVEVTFEPSIVDVKIDQLGDAAKVIQDSVKVMVKTTLAEATLDNLAVAWGYSNQNDIVDTVGQTGYVANQRVLHLGAFLDARPVERSIRFKGHSPEGLDRTYVCRRAMSVSSSTHSYKRSTATLFPVEFRILPDSSQTGSEYGTITDITA